jgi:two-component system response regulator DevR
MAESATGTIRLVIVDDHAIVRQGLRSILEREPDIEVVGEAASAGEALDLVAASRPHIVLLDLKLSAGSDVAGLTLCGQLTATTPAPGVLVVTTFLDQQLVLEAIQRGARGYVLKDVDAVAPSPVVATGPDLTAREREVLTLLARGLSNEAIGRELYISATTAKFHVGNVMRKLAVSRRAEAVYAGSKLGLI